MVLNINETECSDYCLWLNGKKINNAFDIPKNFDLSSLRGYLLGGNLISWLKNHSGEDIAAYLIKHYETINTSEIDVNLLLECAFKIKEKAEYEIKKCEKYNLNYNPKQKIKIVESGSFFTSRSFTHSFKPIKINLHSFLNVKNKGSFLIKYRSWMGSRSSFKILNSSLSSYFWTSSKINFITSLGSSFNLIDKNDLNINEIELMFKICPLNRYGYGIHLI